MNLNQDVPSPLFPLYCTISLHTRRTTTEMLRCSKKRLSLNCCHDFWDFEIYGNSNFFGYFILTDPHYDFVPPWRDWIRKWRESRHVCSCTLNMLWFTQEPRFVTLVFPIFPIKCAFPRLGGRLFIFPAGLPAAVNSDNACACAVKFDASLASHTPLRCLAPRCQRHDAALLEWWSGLTTDHY